MGLTSDEGGSQLSLSDSHQLARVTDRWRGDLVSQSLQSPGGSQRQLWDKCSWAVADYLTLLALPSAARVSSLQCSGPRLAGGVAQGQCRREPRDRLCLSPP